MAKKTIKTRWIWISFAFSIAAATLLVFLSDIPFGGLFWGSLYSFICMALLTLLLFSLRLITASARWKRVSGMLVMLLTFILFLVSILSFIDFRIIALRKFPITLSRAEWRADLATLAKEFPRRHADLFSSVPPDSFDTMIKNLDQKIASLKKEQIVANLMKITALPNDGHTNIFPFPAMDFHFYPLKTFYFHDGWYITDASREHQRAIGSRIIKIGNMNIAAVFERFKKIIGAENEVHKRERFSFWGFSAELLAAEGIMNDVNNGKFLLERPNGEQFSIQATAEPVLNYAYWYYFKQINNDPLPVLANTRKDNYWFDFDEKSKTIYLQFNQVLNRASLDFFNRPTGKSMPQFVEQLQQFIKEHAFERFVIDLRHNIGGNNVLSYPLIEMISNTPEINQKGKLFTIIGRRTYSAGVNFATMLENRTKTLFVGEPSGEGPGQFGDHIKFILPNSGLAVFISTRYWEGSIKEDKRRWITPDIPVHYTYNDFQENHDPAMDVILNYTPPDQHNVAIEKHLIEKFSGRYQFSPYQILEIKKGAAGLSFEISDFTNHGLCYVRSDLYPVSESHFSSDISSVDITFPIEKEQASLTLHWKGFKKRLQKISGDFTLPLQYIHEGNLDAGITAFTEIHNSGFVFPSNIELKLNSEGYRCLRNEKIEDAIRIFALNVSLFPKSANTYDSLGEAYMKGGKMQLAIENYRKAIDLNPENAGAKAILMKIKG